ncbi:Chemotaxis protein cheY [Candidatus Magnetomorum sp. HK-1]|nr:Chemotaxis protein cheY [Candidatus Magnetomorum sp. HK-1]
MKALIVEDDFVSRQLLKDIMKKYSDCDVVIDGEEALQAFRLAWEDENPYDLILMDIMMPRMDGKEALKQIRAFENEIEIMGSQEVKVIMTTALGDPKTVFESYYKGGATSYLVKPLSEKDILEELKKLGLA